MGDDIDTDLTDFDSTDDARSLMEDMAGVEIDVDGSGDLINFQDGTKVRRLSGDQYETNVLVKTKGGGKWSDSQYARFYENNQPNDPEQTEPYGIMYSKGGMRARIVPNWGSQAPALYAL